MTADERARFERDGFSQQTVRCTHCRPCDRLTDIDVHPPIKECRRLRPPRLAI
jgi:hypothetical protein